MAFVLAIKWRELRILFSLIDVMRSKFASCNTVLFRQDFGSCHTKGKDELDMRIAILLPEFGSEWH